MNDINDDDLRARFSELRQEDGRVEPGFRTMWNRAGQSALTERSGIRSNTRWVAVAAAIVIAAALLVGRARDLRREQAAATAQTITTWQSPTAGLLQLSARDLLAPPPVLSSVFDGVASPTLQLKSD